MYRLWKILLMVRGLHDNCCASHTLLRPCRFNSALIRSPICGSSSIPLAFVEPRPQKATTKKRGNFLHYLPLWIYWTTKIERQVQKVHAIQRELKALILLYQ